MFSRKARLLTILSLAHFVVEFYSLFLPIFIPVLVRLLGISYLKERHRSVEFIELLKEVDIYYPKDWKIRLILDNHFFHTSKETQKFLATVPHRFEFIFTPTHGSWLNIIETFFSKMTRTFLRGLRVKSKRELKMRISKWLDEINSSPVVFRWKYKIENVGTQLVL